MRKSIAILTSIGLAVLATGCGNSTPSTDMSQVGKRTLAAMDAYDKYLKANNVTKAEDKHMAQFNALLQSAMNQKPQFHGKLIATQIKKNASFEGFNDDNGNGAVDSGEKRIFTVEIDQANKRIITTDTSGRSSGFGMTGMGFLAGALMGNLMGRQRAAGISPTQFNNRKMSPPAGASRTSSRSRSGARSGGLFRGK